MNLLVYIKIFRESGVSFAIINSIYVDIPVTVGLQQGYYSTSEDSGSIEICVEVESGDTSGRSLSLNYTTVDGSARGTKEGSTYIVTLYISLS